MYKHLIQQLSVYGPDLTLLSLGPMRGQTVRPICTGLKQSHDHSLLRKSYEANFVNINSMSLPD